MNTERSRGRTPLKVGTRVKREKRQGTVVGVSRLGSFVKVQWDDNGPVRWWPKEMVS